MRGFIRGASKNWTYESGGQFDIDGIYPVVDMAANRLYGINKNDEEDVVVVQSYHPTAQRGAARNFALWVWGPAEKWERPDASARIASCMGMPACSSCLLEPLPAMDTNYNWRIQPFGKSQQVLARRLTAPDKFEEHLIAEQLFERDFGKAQKELMRRCIALFGEPYDLATGEIKPAYQEAYFTTPS